MPTPPAPFAIDRYVVATEENRACTEHEIKINKRQERVINKVHCRNSSTETARNVKFSFERNLVDSVLSDQKQFWKYVHT